MSNTAVELPVRVPYQVVPTDLPGVYTTPALPTGFDPQTASATELIRQGLLWNRPGAGADPAFIAAWQELVSRDWSAAERIVPEMEVHTGKIHVLRSPRKQSDGNYESPNWGGGVVAGTFTVAIGTWVIPTVSKPSEQQDTEGGWNSSSWVGIDGWSTTDVLQAGVEQMVAANGQYQKGDTSPDYVYEVAITNFDVLPGQTVSASIQYVGRSAGQITFANQTTGQHFQITLAPPAGAAMNGSSVEWIIEAPDGGEPVSSLPKFTPVVFTRAVGCGPGNAVGNPKDGTIVNVVDANNKTLTSVSLSNTEGTIDFVG